MEVIARARYIRRAPRKARLVAQLVEGQRVVDALAQLEFLPKHAAKEVSKAIKSAAANAEHNHNLARDELWLKQVMVDNGPIIKRLRPVSRGMAHWYFHRTCHITAIVEDRLELPSHRQRTSPRRRASERAEIDDAGEPLGGSASSEEVSAEAAQGGAPPSEQGESDLGS